MSQLVAVTGAEGFIGSHLVEALVASGTRVRAMVLYNSFGSHGWLESLPAATLADVEVVLGDVRDDRSAHDFLDGVECVYHLAALIAIPYSYRVPRSYLDTNAGGTLNVLEAARDHRTPRVVCTSTSEVYGTARRVPIDESHPLQGQSPYSASKIAADKIAEAYHLSFGLPVVTIRPFNTFGPRQSARAVIPTIISQVAAGERRVRVGALDPTRDFMYVADTARAFLAVGTAPIEAVAGQVLNAGTGREVSISELFAIIGSMMGRDIEPAPEDDRMRPMDSEVMRLVCDASRLRSLTGWQPKHSLEDGLQNTIAWFSDPLNLARYKASIFNL